METDTQRKLQEICEIFCISGTFKSYEEIKLGNINKTYKVTYEKEDGSQESYIVQSVNTYVFKNPIQVMENIDKVTEHLREKRPERTTLKFYHTKDGKTYYFENDGFWRLFNYITSTTYSVCDDLQVVHNAGREFGEFQVSLSDFDVSKLYDTIPDFHNTRKRYETMIQHIEEDSCGKVKEVADEIEYLLSVQDKACRLTDLLEQGKLPLRVTHNDTKINNVLFAKDSQEPLVVIDLDTVMPGLVGHDFGDAIRFAGNYVEEDCPELEKVGVNIEVFRAFAEGFLSVTANVLSESEIETLALGCFVLTCEQAVRFLDDYIQGSPYFKINYPEHNLIRTRCQVALAKDMEQHMDEMQKIVLESAKRYR